MSFEVAFTPLPSVCLMMLDVEGIYTYRAEPEPKAVRIDVVVFPAKRNRYTLPTARPVPASPAGQKQ